MTRVLLTGWQELPLGKACKIYTGNSINEQEKKVKYTNLADGYNYIATKDITLNSVINYNNGIKIPFKETKFRVAPQNSSLLCIEGGSAGRKIGFTNQPVCFVNKLCAFCADTSLLDPYFLFFYLQTPVFKSVFQDKKTGLIGGVSTSKLKSLPILFPSLPEQKRIVEKLDKIFADLDKAKENTQKNLENAKEMFRAQLTEVFNLLKTDGAQVELQNVCAKISAGGDKPAAFSKEPTSRYKIPVYANGEQNDGLLGFTDVPTISQPAITVAARGTIGFACKRMIPYCPIVRLISLIPDTEKISLDFLFYALKYLIPTGNGTSIPQLTLPTIRKFRISYPTSLDAQAKVVEKLNHLQNTTRELEKTYTKTLSILEELKQSVLQQAFSGKL